MDMKRLQNGSDIRGTAIAGVPGEDKNLGAYETFCLTRGFLEWLAQKCGKDVDGLKVAVGRDPRLSGKMLADAALFAMTASGVICYDFELASTPAMFMSTVFPEFNCDGAIMITASHLPANRNGFKYFSKDGGLGKHDISDIIRRAEALMPNVYGNNAVTPRLLLIEKELADLEDILENSENTKDTSPCGRRLSPLMRVYSAHLRNVIRHKLNERGIDEELPLQGLKIVVDAGNGSGGFFAEHVLAGLGADTAGSQFLEADGRFPNHPPNPENKEAMAAIRACVLDNSADLGLIFDTDVDRASAVDEHGAEIAGDGIVAMAALIAGRDRPGATIVTDSVTGDGLTDFLENELGLRHFRYKRGYRNVIDKAVELNREGLDCPLAIETSGHAAVRENFFLDDGAYLAACIVVEAASQAHATPRVGVSALLAGLRVPAAALEYRIPVRGAENARAIKNKNSNAGAAEKATKNANENTKISDSDVADRILSELKNHAKKMNIEVVEPSYEGVRLKFPPAKGDGWCLIRKSLHDPIMPLNIQSNRIGGEIEIREFIKDFLNQYDEIDTSIFAP